MDAATDTTVYERTLAIDASPETVWEFLVDPEKLMRWKGINADLDTAARRHLPLRGHPGPHRPWRIRRDRQTQQARLHLGLGRQRRRSPGLVDDRDRARVGWRRHQPPLRAPGPTERGSNRLACTRLGPLPTAPRDGRRRRRPGRGPLGHASTIDVKGEPVMAHSGHALRGRRARTSTSSRSSTATSSVGTRRRSPETCRTRWSRRRTAASAAASVRRADGNGHVTFYVGTDDPQATLDKAEQLGGKTILPVTELPEVTIALFADPEGHVVGLAKGM